MNDAHSKVGAGQAGERRAPTDAQDSLRRMELAAILGTMSREKRADAEKRIWGLALSGGGIRSATFCLGVLQALAGKGWLAGFHYVSTVSGGGYIGAYLQGLLHRRGVRGALNELDPAHRYKDALSGATRAPEQSRRTTDKRAEKLPGETIRDLRRFSNYLTPNKAGLSSDRVTMVSTYVSNMLLTQVQLASWLILIMFLPLLVYVAAAWLATDPWMSVSIAMLCVLIAMGMRGLVQYRFEHASVPQQTPGTFAKTARVLPPILIAVAMMSLAMLLWGVDDCGIRDDDLLCRRWTGLTGFAERRYFFRGLTGALPMDPLKPARDAFQALAMASVYLAAFVAWLVWWCVREVGADDFGYRLLRQIVVGAIVIGCVGLLALLIAEGNAAAWFLQKLPGGLRNQTPHLWWTVILGTPAMMLIFFIASLAHVGLTFSSARDRVARERWARLMGRTSLIVVLGISLPVAVVSIGPWVVQLAASTASEFAPGDAVKWLLPLASLAMSAIGARFAYNDQTVDARSHSRLTATMRRVVIAVAPAALVFGLLMLTAVAADILLSHYDRKIRFVWPFPPRGSLSEHLFDLHGRLFDPPWSDLGLLLGAIALVGFVFAKYIDENEFSMNGFYRNRLVRCYLAPSNANHRGDPEMDLDPAGDDIELGDLLHTSRDEDPIRVAGIERRAHRPLYPLISAAANLTATRDLDWQDRRAASFVFSPLFCGHIPLPKRGSKPIGDLPPRDMWHDDLRPSDLTPSPLAADTTLGTAVSISGAAVSPQMGYHSSPSVAFLLTLFNARLGWWVENLNVSRGFLGRVGSKLLSELLSRSNDGARFAYVSDGGHFENLAIYELVRRRCRFILSVDATADPDRDFACLGNAIHKCRVDLGASIDIDVSLMRPDKQGISRRCATLGKILYNDGSTGLMLYVKPSLLGNETADIANYANAHAEFPHQPTHDQFFDEHQFESYRELGFRTGERLLTSTSDRRNARVHGKAPITASNPLTVDDDEDRKETLLLELEHWLFEPTNATALRFSQHGAALARLLERQRRSPDLACLDDQINPGWVHAGGRRSGAPRLRDAAMEAAVSTPHARLPGEAVFRPCFYFVQEVIQLMEAVYIDLDLERNSDHPDNRGWMNLFRQWAWVPMFKLVWSLTSHMLGSRFVRFCETRLGFPQLSSALWIDWREIRELRHQAGAWLDDEEITFVEHEVLTCEAIIKSSQEHWMKVGVVRVDWSSILGVAADYRPGLTKLNVGIIVAVCDRDSRDFDTIIVARVQDHLRRMGFGEEMLYRAVESTRSIKHARIACTTYGKSIGPLSEETARQQQGLLQDMIDRAHQREGLGAAQAPAESPP